MADEFYLSDAQWERRAALLPNKPRGVPRVDDQRIISGIAHVLTSSGCSDASRTAVPGVCRRRQTISGAAEADGFL